MAGMVLAVWALQSLTNGPAAGWSNGCAGGYTNVFAAGLTNGSTAV